VYVYTNSRVLNQNVMFMDEVAKEWYKQSVISKDSNSNGSTNLFHEFNDHFDTAIPYADMDGMSIDDDSIIH
jgi:hypothetical protein